MAKNDSEGFTSYQIEKLDLDKLEKGKKYSIEDIAYQTDTKLTLVQKTYKESFRLIQDVVYLFRCIEEIDKEYSIQLDCTEVVNINNILKSFPLQHFRSVMNLDPRIVVFLLCTNPKVQSLFGYKPIRYKINVKG